MGIRNPFANVTFTLKKHVSKIYLIAFPVLLLAVAELVIFLVISNGKIKMAYSEIAIFMSILAIVAIAGILHLYNKLVNPLRLAKKALNNYVISQEIPQPPDHSGDEAGLL